MMSNMFDLEKAIAEWRRRMLTAGVESPVPLEELENHLREDVEQQIRSGSDQQAAFACAVEGIGAGSELAREFGRCPSSNNNLMKIMKQKLIYATVAFVLVAVGAAFIMPAIAKWQHVGTLAGMDIVLLLLGTVMCTLGLDFGVRRFIRR
jgi:hypothetical protein